MQIKEEFKLIDGTFSQTEAMEILDNVFSSKIQFHKMKNFSSQIRFGKDDDFSKDRIVELNKIIEAITQLIKDPKIGNRKIKVTSVVNISFADSE
jgi:dihydroorotase